MFSYGLEFGNFILSSDLLHYSWAKIIDLQNESCSNDPNSFLSIRHKVYDHPEFGTIIVFVSSSPCTIQDFREDLVLSKNLLPEFPDFEFIGTKFNPSFSINKATVDLYASIKNELFSLIEYVGVRPLIITGYSIGGSIASLFTLWLLEHMSLKVNVKRPLCITFGSPFLGDSGFQRAILERPTWHSSFLHVVTVQDPIPHLFTTSIYKPFGVSLLCSESGCAYLEEPEMVFDLMVKNRKVHIANFGTNEMLQVIDYGNVLEKLRYGTIFRGLYSELGEQDISPLRAGIVSQIEAICEKSQMNGKIDSIIEEIEQRMTCLMDRKKHVFDPKKKLNDIKIHMTYMEWYKKVEVSNGGYYDSFKSKESQSRGEIVKRKNKLTRYWSTMVKEVEKKPKKEDAFLGFAYLYAGTNYRRMVEPLNIAEWYKKGKTNYLAMRSEHYKLLEKWVKEDPKTKSEGKNRVCSLTEDSCFWAHVEEAIIKCKSLSGLGRTLSERSEMLVDDLVIFEDYVMGLIKNCAVSAEIFLKQSSFMKWWENYEKIKGDNYHSTLADFMRNQKYRDYT